MLHNIHTYLIGFRKIFRPKGQPLPKNNASINVRTQYNLRYVSLPRVETLYPCHVLCDNNDTSNGDKFFMLVAFYQSIPQLPTSREAMYSL